jgi:hypothetical protein
MIDFYLKRLERLAGLVGLADRSDVPEWRRLARRATFSAYLDCVGLGAAEEANAIVRRVRLLAEPKPSPASGHDYQPPSPVGERPVASDIPTGSTHVA